MIAPRTGAPPPPMTPMVRRPPGAGMMPRMPTLPDGSSIQITGPDGTSIPLAAPPALAGQPALADQPGNPTQPLAPAQPGTTPAGVSPQPAGNPPLPSGTLGPGAPAQPLPHP